MIESLGDLFAIITVIGCTIWTSLDSSVEIREKD